MAGTDPKQPVTVGPRALGGSRRSRGLLKMSRNHVLLSLYWVLISITACASGVADEREHQASASGDRNIAITSLPTSLAERIAKRSLENDFSGSVLISRDGEIVLHQTFGPMSSRSRNSEPAYWIASSTKQFMGAVIALLASDGKLDLDAQIGQYLDEVPQEKAQITLRQLLTHTSGLGQQYAAEGIVDRDKATLAILQTELVHPPATGYSYSNDGFSLAAIIAEIASGLSYEELLRTRLFDAAGLTRTGFWGFENDEEIAPVPASAAVTNQSKKIYSNGRSQANWGYRGATGIYSTAKDLYSWLTWLIESGVDRENPMSQVLSPERFIREAEGLGTVYYGLGIAVIERGGSMFMISHIGDDDWLGHNSTVTAYADGDIIVVLSNSGYLDDGTPWSAEITSDIRRLLQK